jgi:squalene-hopene/tetraprenyl-beta-curcumene cyclase
VTLERKQNSPCANKRENPDPTRQTRRVPDEPAVPPPAPRIDRERLHRAQAKARAALLAERGPHGHWEGELSSSALSTATAVTALELWQRHANPVSQSGIASPQSAIDAGLQWLVAHQNTDGGWGDTTLSFSNISTTALCWAAFGAVPGAEAKWPATVQRAEAWLAKASVQSSVISNQSSDQTKPPFPTENWTLNTEHSSTQSVAQPQTPNPKLETNALVTAIIARYGKDRTFSVPILTMCALAGRLGQGREAWRRVIQLPFELAALPQKFFAALRLPVVSYALPALIAIGQVRHHHLPTRNPLTRLMRNRARAKTLRVLERIQPTGGGFLEATPLTSFVTMSLAGSNNADHPVALHGVEFLLKSMRPDGSWPIDTNLATWVTTLAVNALGPSIYEVMSAEERQRILEWLLAQQYRTVHPYTDAAPGGWAWTDLPGGVPDADDTAGALLALKLLGSSRCKEAPSAQSEIRNSKSGINQSLPTSAATQDELDPRVREAAIAAVKWLLDLQNRDGGIPTFCRGWTNLPFDRSSPDITAHALRAWLAWRDELPSELQARMVKAACAATRFLVANRNFPAGWTPLWFGNQSSPGEVNHTYGTSRVLLAAQELAVLVNRSSSWLTGGSANLLKRIDPESAVMMNWAGWTALHTIEDRLGAWGGAIATPRSIEETALAVEAIAGLLNSPKASITAPEGEVRATLVRGAGCLMHNVELGTWTRPAPIGFYFAKLWYYERLYPMVFTVAALEAVARLEPVAAGVSPAVEPGVPPGG